MENITLLAGLLSLFIIVACASFLVGSYLRDYFSKWYEFCGIKYRVFRTVKCRCRKTGEWYNAIAYKDVQGNLFVCETKSFLKMFALVKRNK